MKGELANVLNYREVLARVGVPAEVIPSFSLHGRGKQLVRSEAEAEVLVPQALSQSPIGEVLVRRV